MRITIPSCTPCPLTHPSTSLGLPKILSPCPARESVGGCRVVVCVLNDQTIGSPLGGRCQPQTQICTYVHSARLSRPPAPPGHSQSRPAGRSRRRPAPTWCTPPGTAAARRRRLFIGGAGGGLGDGVKGDNKHESGRHLNEHVYIYVCVHTQTYTHPSSSLLYIAHPS